MNDDDLKDGFVADEEEDDEEEELEEEEVLPADKPADTVPSEEERKEDEFGHGFGAEEEELS
ncbi:MAG TPA: hypothetical protein VJJ27_01605 [Candidatus Paceibacterota bacterium]